MGGRGRERGRKRGGEGGLVGEEGRMGGEAVGGREGGKERKGGEGGMEYSIENHMCSCRMEGPAGVIWEGW